MPPGDKQSQNPQEWERDVRRSDRWHPARCRSRPRFTANEHKLHATIGGLAVWQHSLQQLLAAHIGPTIVVTGATPLELDPYEVHEVHNLTGRTGKPPHCSQASPSRSTIKLRRRSSDLLISPEFPLKHGNESQVQMPSSPPPHMAVSQVTP